MKCFSILSGRIKILQFPFRNYTAEFEIDNHVLKRYEILCELGKGDGITWIAIYKKTGEFVVLKKIIQAFYNDTDAQRTYQEVQLLMQFAHPNIIRLQNVMRAQNDQDIFLVYDYMESDLYRVIQTGVLQEPHKQYILYQILKALKYLHSGNLIHCDLKPSNYLINSACDVALCEFGHARSLSSPEIIYPDKTEYFSNRWYRPPELFLVG